MSDDNQPNQKSFFSATYSLPGSEPFILLLATLAFWVGVGHTRYLEGAETYVACFLLTFSLATLYDHTRRFYVLGLAFSFAIFMWMIVPNRQYSNAQLIYLCSAPL